MDDSDSNLISGLGSASDYDLVTGGVYADGQDPYTASDNGTVNNAVQGTGSASTMGTLTPPANGSSYTPPSWLQSLMGLTTAAGNVVTTISPIVGGKPAAGPLQAGQGTPALGSATLSAALSNPIYLLIGAVVIFFLFFKRRRA